MQQVPEDEMIALANEVIDLCNEYDFIVVITVLANVTGQLLVATSDGAPVLAKQQLGAFSEAVQVAINQKLLHDADHNNGVN